MRRTLWLLLLCAAPGCSAMNNTDRGMLAGGVLGGAAGTAIGGANGNAGAGAAIGAASGALLGGIIGNQEDKAERQAAIAQAAHAQQHPPLGISDVARLAQQHISDDVIINQIRTTGSVYQLNPNEISYLKSQGVSDRVVMEMQSRRTSTVQQAVYVVDPPPPPVRVGVGFNYGWPNRHHHYRCW